VMVLWSTNVPVEEVFAALSRQLQATSSEDAPGSRVASRMVDSETLTFTDRIRAVLKPGAANVTS